MVLSVSVLGLWVVLSISNGINYLPEVTYAISVKEQNDQNHHHHEQGTLGARDLYHNNDSLPCVEADVDRIFINIATFSLHNSPVGKFCFFC